MNLSQLRSFESVARLRNFTRAAEELFITQPSLSRQIAALEHDLGAGLFSRSRKGTVLTAAGESLLPLARRMLADESTARQELRNLRNLSQGRVRLGATPTLSVSLVADVIRDYHAAFPGVDLLLSENGSRSLVDDLSQGMLDLALVVAPDLPKTTGVSLHHTPLLTEELVAAVSEDVPLLGLGTDISLAALAQVPQIRFATSYDLRASADAAFAAAGEEQTTAVAGVEMDAALRFVERGIGWALVPAMVLHEHPQLRALRVRDAGLSRTVSIAQSTDLTPPPAVAEMRSMLERTAVHLARERAPLVKSITKSSRRRES